MGGMSGRGKEVEEEKKATVLNYLGINNILLFIRQFFSNILIADGSLKSLLPQFLCNFYFQHIKELDHSYSYCHLNCIMCIAENVIRKITM